MATAAQRRHILAVWDMFFKYEHLIDYGQVRPMHSKHWSEQELLDHFVKGGKIIMDCSETVTLVCRFAGLADPNGLNYNGTGYTGTMLNHLPHYDNPRAAGLGALVVFGPGNGDHVCQVLKSGANPTLGSHGQNSGPLRISLAAETAAHKPPVRFLSVAHL